MSWVVDCGSQNCRIGRGVDSVFTNDDFPVTSRSYVRNWKDAIKLFKAGFKQACSSEDVWPQLEQDFEEWTRDFDPVRFFFFFTRTRLDLSRNDRFWLPRECSIP